MKRANDGAKRQRAEILRERAQEGGFDWADKGEVIDIRDLLRGTMALQPLPQSAHKLAVLCSGEVDIEEIARVVSMDQALAVRTLRAANGAAGGSLHAIKSIHAAVMRLGPTMVASLAMGSSIQGQMNAGLPQLGLSDGELWRHAISASIASEELRVYAAIEIPDEASAASLLHDIGKLVLEPHVRRYMRLGMRRAFQETEDTGIVAERDWLTLDHASLGAMVARRWELPEVMAAGIAHHHDPSQADEGAERIVAHTIHVADAVAKLALDGFDRVYFDPLELEQSLSALGVSPKDLEPLTQTVTTRTTEVVAAYAR